MKRDELFRSVRGVLAFCAVAFVSSVSATVKMGQDVYLVEGWNSVYLSVGPDESADVLFRDWPCEWVALYDPAAFRETRQYTATGDTGGVVKGGYRMWRRDEPGACSFTAVPANSILLCFATNAYAQTVYGVPAAPRFTWHRSTQGGVLNMIGFSVYEPVTTDGYFSGLSVGTGPFYLSSGTDRAKPMLMISTLVGTMSFGDHEVLAVDSQVVSDWSGVLYVSPVNGVDFGSEVSRQSVSVRNDGATARTVSASLSVAAGSDLDVIPAVPQGLKVRTAPNGAWSDFTTAASLSRNLAPGETWKLELALDRSALGGTAGTEYGALVTFKDVDGGSKMRVTVPLSVVSDGGASSEYAWPKGIWLATAELDTVTFFGERTVLPPEVDPVGERGEEEGGGEKEESDDPVIKEEEVESYTEEIPARGRMSVRLPVYVDGEGGVTLLQRFWYGRDTNGTLRVFAGSVSNTPCALTGIRRISTPFLPTDQPLVAADTGAVFGRAASFSFTVGEHSNVNPMRHPLHPRHDGLSADYSAPSPSGDDLQNYLSTVKPELFSITNRVSVRWTETEAAAWNPAEVLSGNLIWEFDGLRREGTVRASGPFMMRRISPAKVER